MAIGRTKWIGAMLTLALCVGCGPASLESAELGKVVIYRNGVALFERVMTVEDGEVTLLVAKEKVDDLLKSLTIRDAETGKKLPISFPSRSQSQKVVRMTIRVETEAPRKVRLSYVSESPAWKPSYRINLGDDGNIRLAAWAVVDNVSGEDWKNVLVGVGSSSALSFRYDLWTVRDVQRQTLSAARPHAVAPPSAASVTAKPTNPAAGTTQAVTLDKDYVQNIPVPGRTFESALGAAAGTQDDSLGVSFSGTTSLENAYVVDGINTSGVTMGTRGRPSVKRRSDAEIKAEQERREYYLRQRRAAAAQAARMKRQNKALAEQLRQTKGRYAIVGVASPHQKGGETAARSMADHVRNELIQLGVSPGRLVTRTRTGDVGEPTTIEVAALDADEGEQSEAVRGESKFMSAVPISIPHDGSSLVSVATQQAKGTVVYLYDADSPRGNDRFAFKAVKFSNPTKQFLEGGPVTVFDHGSFIGEGLIDAIGPGQGAVLPYAMDRQVSVERSRSFEDRILGFESSLGFGAVVRARREAEVKFRAHNRSPNDVVLWVRHDTDRGWTLRSKPAGMHQIGRMTLFPVKVAAGKRKTVSIVEHTPISLTIDLTSDQGVAALRGYLAHAEPSSEFAKSATQLVDLHKSIKRKFAKLDLVAGQLAIYRSRLDQMHIQLLTLEAVKSKGRIVRGLNRRIATTTDRVSAAILEIVELQEQIMLERFAYNDLVIATLSLATTNPSAN